MQRGEIWWADFDERRPVVLLSACNASEFLAIQVVAPADINLADLGFEIPIGLPEGLPFDGVLRFVFSRPGFIPCTWLTTLRRQDLLERAGTVPVDKLEEIGRALDATSHAVAWTETSEARFRELKESLCRTEP